MNPIKIIQKLEDLIKEHQATSLTSPKGRDAFAYGEAVGINTGLHLAREAIEKELEQAEQEELERERRLDG